MPIQENVSIGTKTTMKIGGIARYYAELKTRTDAEEAQRFAKKKHLPLIPLGSGANTVFADGTINAVVVRIAADDMMLHGESATVEAGKPLASLIMELAKENLDLSALTGIPGTVGGAIVGNAGQGPSGTWLDAFVLSVTALIDGEWKMLEKEECGFSYRESVFKTTENAIVWSVTLELPSRPKAEILADVERLLKKRIETQPHVRTAGSCFKALWDGTPAWKAIDAAGLKGFRVGGVAISEKHANFLINEKDGTFEDLAGLLKQVRAKVPDLEGIEMRLYGEDGSIVDA